MEIDIPSLIGRREFERLFVDELGWDRLRRRESVSVVAPGQLTRGWLSAEERARKADLRHHTFDLAPVAQKRGQVVYEVVWRDSDRLPDTIARLVVARQVAKTHYEPLLIFTAKGSPSQVWLWAHNGDEGLEPCEHHFSVEDQDRLPSRLETVRFRMDEEEGLSVLSVQQRLKDAFFLVRRIRRLERRQIDPETVRRRWESLHELARLAADHRGIDKDEERALVSMALDGNASAKRRLTLAHLYLPIDQTLKRWERAPLAGTDVPDLVQAGMMGLLRAVALYDFTQTPRLQTFASLWVRRSLDFAWRHQGRQIRIPNHVFDALEKTMEGQRIIVDGLSQMEGRPVSDQEALDLQNLDDKDRGALTLMGLSFVPLDDDACERLSDDLDSERATAMIRNPRPDCLIDQQAVAGFIDGLIPKHRDVLLLRYGLHPDHPGDEMTLEQTAEVVQVSPERARQIQKQAIATLRALAVEAGKRL